jgi:hypothetical protein
MPSIGQTWVLASIGAVVEMGILSTLKRLLMESKFLQARANAEEEEEEEKRCFLYYRLRYDCRYIGYLLYIDIFVCRSTSSSLIYD